MIFESDQFFSNHQTDGGYIVFIIFLQKESESFGIEKAV